MLECKKDSAIHIYHQLVANYEPSEKTPPDNFNSSSTFRLFFFPLWLIPVQFIEHHNKCRNQIQVFVHPTSLQDSFWNIPFIGCPLKTLRLLKQGNKSIYRPLSIAGDRGIASRFLSLVDMFVIFPFSFPQAFACY